jgi:hypothetical protein
MNVEKVVVRTEAGQSLEVEVTSMNVDAIWVILGSGEHSIKCKLTPTRNCLAYAGSAMGREIIYERSVKQVREDLARRAQASVHYKPRR